MSIKIDLDAIDKRLDGAGMCQCGCGSSAPVARRTNARLGHVKGQPLRFVSGHNSAHGDPIDRVIVGIDCWLWRGGHDAKGYGRVQWKRTHTGAHRFVYERLVGPIPEGMQLDHLCRNTGCVNPDHLEVVTPSENRRRQHGFTQFHCDTLTDPWASVIGPAHPDDTETGEGE